MVHARAPPSVMEAANGPTLRGSNIARKCEPFRVRDQSNVSGPSRRWNDYPQGHIETLRYSGELKLHRYPCLTVPYHLAKLRCNLKKHALHARASLMNVGAEASKQQTTTSSGATDGLAC